MKERGVFLCPLRHSLPLIPYSVTNHQPCRNNSDNNLANFLESAVFHRTFASVIWIIRLFILHICFMLLVIWFIVSNDLAYGVRWEASPFAISSYSYIKPQLRLLTLGAQVVVYHPIPTSSHNRVTNRYYFRGVVYHPIPTSNHNSDKPASDIQRVVYHPIPTSNHNPEMFCINGRKLYIILFLHQTTTVEMYASFNGELYIILFLHQTTTRRRSWSRRTQLYIILFLHQTTTWKTFNSISFGCISSYSYIKPQLSRNDCTD